MRKPSESPLALGALGLAAATILISSIELDWVSIAGWRVVAIALIAFTSPLQLIVAAAAFTRRDSVVATGMAILSATWLSVGLVMLGTSPKVGHPAFGIFLLVCAGALLVPGSAAAVAGRLSALLLLTASARLTLTGLHALVGGSALDIAAGLVGLVLAAVAIVVAARDIWLGSVSGHEQQIVVPDKAVRPRRPMSRSSVERLVERVRQQL
jgi:uncharacterized protein